mmetsp:Transcript_20213/g.17898  ORF Transcript_20213/g.17898 Transcript_20213/m.17898 type:complete len:86 (+) Transcript_20213:54-311(+)
MYHVQRRIQLGKRNKEKDFFKHQYNQDQVKKQLNKSLNLRLKQGELRDINTSKHNEDIYQNEMRKDTKQMLKHLSSQHKNIISQK